MRQNHGVSMVLYRMHSEGQLNILPQYANPRKAGVSPYGLFARMSHRSGEKRQQNHQAAREYALGYQAA